jgi:hypothetical protein
MWNETNHTRWRIFHPCRFQSIRFVTTKKAIDSFLFLFNIANDDQFQSDENDRKDFKFVRYLTREKVNQFIDGIFSDHFILATGNHSCYGFLYN